MRHPDQQPAMGQTLADVPLYVGNILIGVCSVTIDPGAVEADQLKVLTNALRLQDEEGMRAVVSISSSGAVRTPAVAEAQTVNPNLEAMGFDSHFCQLWQGTTDGIPTPIVTTAHFDAADAKQGKAAYDALCGGTHERYFYSRELEAFVVRDADKRIVGFHASVFDRLVDRLEVIHSGVHNFGARRLEACRRLRRRLYLDNEQ